MDINTIGALIYSIVAVVVAIISATIIWIKDGNWQQFDIGMHSLACFLE